MITPSPRSLIPSALHVEAADAIDLERHVVRLCLGVGSGPLRVRGGQAVAAHLFQQAHGRRAADIGRVYADSQGAGRSSRWGWRTLDGAALLDASQTGLRIGDDVREAGGYGA